MRNSKGQFQLGHSGGRPKGARNRLAAQVFEDILRHWCEPAAPGSKLCKGAEALETLYKEKPGEYLRLTRSMSAGLTACARRRPSAATSLSMSRLYVVQRIRFGLSGYSSSAGSPPSVVAIAHPSHHIDIQLVRSHLVERGLGGMSVRA
jgi:hypothetical protein